MLVRKSFPRSARLQLIENRRNPSDEDKSWV
jgi:hypothetical protein